MAPAVVFVIAALACTDLERVLGLSGEQAAGSQIASARPEERRAVELSRTIPGLAGFFYDTSGNVIVAVKGIPAATVTRARLQPLFRHDLARSRRRHPNADIIVRGAARYTFIELRSWRDRLVARDVLSLSGVVWLDLDEVANRVVVGLEAGSDAGAVRALARDAGLPTEALDVEQTTPYEPHGTVQDQFRPIQGGIQIQRVVGTSRAACTLGFAALWNNQQVFVTAGHCSPDLMGTDSVAQYQPIAPLTPAESATTAAIGREIFRYSQGCGSSRCASSDAAIYGLMPAQAWQRGRIAHPTYGCLGPCSPVNLTVSGYWVIDSTWASFLVNDLVSRIGSATGWSQGYVSRTCVDVTPTHGVIYRCQMFAGLGGDDGDSGSPILLDIQGGADSTVTLGGIHSGKSGRNWVFSPWSGIVQDYGSLVVVPAPQDTSRPPVPQSFLLPDDSTRTVPAPWGTAERFYRDIVGVAFDDTTSGTTIRDILSKYQATIIAGARTFPYPVYYLQIPDPGGTYTAIDSIAQALNREAGVFAASIPQWRGRLQIRYRYPNDGPSARRSDWASRTDATRSLLAIRAPLAWGCENGAYAQTTRVAFIDREFQTHNDLVATLRPPVNRIRFLTIPTIDDLEHGQRVAGIFGATGDNGVGIAGMMWRSDLTLYAMGANGGETSSPYLEFLLHMVHLSDTLGIRILSMSSTFGAPSDTANIRWITQGLRFFFQNGGILVYAIGNDPNARPTISQLRSTMDTAYSGLDKAVAILRDSLGFADNIITVGASDTTGAFLSSTTFWRSGTDILAPGQQILTLGLNNTTSIAPYGTSYAVPYVTGVIAQLVTMDPSLTPAQVKGYILRGARQPRPNVQTGQVALPPPVPGAPETVYQLDAYGSLTLLAAERQRIPLCGNRVWVQSNTVFAERDTTTHTVEELVQLNGPRWYVNVFHGGRRIEALDDTSSVWFEFQQDHWAPAQAPATEPYGGTFVSMEARSHDLDTLVTDQQWTSADTAFFVYTAKTLNPSTQRIIDTLKLALSRFTGGECVRRESDGDCNLTMPSVGSEDRVIGKVSYAPVGNRLFGAVNYLVTRWVAFSGWSPCPLPEPNADPTTCRNTTYQEVSERSEVWAIDLTTGAETFRWTIPGQVYWLGVSEDGGQLVSGEGVLTTVWTWQPRQDGSGFEQVWSNPGTITGCGVHFRSLFTGADARPHVPTVDGCSTRTRGNGTIAPVAAVK